ncbi:ABC transporter ATP-binding protein [Bacillus sp. ISL-34]|uniref:ABC transporter ATP-binding protein n=1 Tax=Bacillus sp. ISL-34 TaxID=2819121 RepID=UPI001BE9C85F|nr:ABC transporter ATP-binding protein [Bacillus sp. ISL-34]MBT2650121.1 ABC transporter ATP-binding protein [Bacillus sp. ISL-34]
MDSIIKVKNVEKSYGNQLIVDRINLDVTRGEFLTLLGPSGCGKTTTLRMIAGFEEPDSGEVLLDGQSVVGVPPYKRDVNTVFQSYALFPHMSVIENIAYGLKMKKVPRSEIESRVKESLRLVQLEQFGNRKPRQLSGGQQQRVAVARALVNNPKVLLLDEPLGALDLKLRKEMQYELKQLQKKLEITFIYVTHDQEEALTMSDRIAVMNRGRIEQIDVPEEIYKRPLTKFVADFIGDTNLFEVSVVDNHLEYPIFELEGCRVGGRFGKEKNIEGPMYLSVRPERLKLMKDNDNAEFLLGGTIEEIIFAGLYIQTIVKLNIGTRLTAVSQNAGEYSYQLGEYVYVTWNEEDGIVIGNGIRDRYQSPILIK